MAAEKSQILQAFEPVSRPDARVLVLGSMPGVESLRKRQYYGFARNAFWPIMGELCGFDPAISYEARCEQLRQSKIALWDVCCNCVRPGSLDSNISNEKPNDFAAFFANHREIRAIFFNGQTAARLFYRHVDKQDAEKAGKILNTEPVYRTLPSTSPANAGMNFEQKLEKWRDVLQYIH